MVHAHTTHTPPCLQLSRLLHQPPTYRRYLSAREPFEPFVPASATSLRFAVAVRVLAFLLCSYYVNVVQYCCTTFHALVLVRLYRHPSLPFPPFPAPYHFIQRIRDLRHCPTVLSHSNAVHTVSYRTSYVSCQNEVVMSCREGKNVTRGACILSSKNEARACYA